MWTMTSHGRLDLLSALGRGVLLLSLLQIGCIEFGIRINTTASLPIGLYMECADPAAKLVEFCPPAGAASMALARGYRTAGVCLDGGEPLLKPIVAKPGDIVTVSQDGIAVNSKLLRNSRPHHEDSFRRKLTPWPSGAYAVASGTVWVISTYNDKSFDSRYFGPIPVTCVRAHLKPLMTE